MSGDKVADLPTPALVVDMAALDHNIAAMAEVLPGDRLRPHVKAHKCTSLARRQAAVGHRGRSEEHTSELQSRPHLVCRLLLEKKKKHHKNIHSKKKKKKKHNTN